MKISLKNTLVGILGLSLSLFIGYSIRNPNFDLFNITDNITYALRGFVDLINIVGAKIQSLIV